MRYTAVLLVACSPDPADGVVEAPDFEVVDVVDTPRDTVDTPEADTPDADTPAVDTPEPSCLAAPAELTCGGGPGWSSFVPLTEGQDVEMVYGTAGGVWVSHGVLVRNTEQGVRWWHRVTDLQSGTVLGEGRQLLMLRPVVDGAWACDGYEMGVLAWIALGELSSRDLVTALCGHEALIEMASEDVQSSPDAPTVYAASSVRVILRPEPLWEITCD